MLDVAEDGWEDIDMLNPYDHEDADVLAENVEAIVQPIVHAAASLAS